jgi:hypothetical protein
MRDCHNQTIPMKTQSTYSLLVRSQEKGRSLFETAVYSLLVLCAIASVGQFATQAVTLPGDAVAKTSPTVIVAEAAPQRPLPVRG